MKTTEFHSPQQNQQAVIMSPPAYNNTKISEQSKLSGASNFTTASPALSTSPAMTFQSQQTVPGVLGVF